MRGRCKRVLVIFLCLAAAAAVLLLSLLPAGEISYAQRLLMRCGLSARTGEDVHKLVFLDVGQGDCALLLSGGQAALIDTGTGLDDAISLIQTLRREGVVSLDFLFLSHPHSDHIGGAASLLEAFPIGQICCPAAPPEDAADAILFEQLKAAAKKAGVPFSDYRAQASAVGSFTVTPLYRDDYLPDENDRSQFLMVSGFGFSALFTGDCGSAGESSLLHDSPSISADLLKIGHHGSGASTTEAFLDAVQPRFAVISVGEGNSYGHPADAVLDRLDAAGCEVFRTDVNGKITFDFSDGLAVYTER
ncbi:MAG: ComEC/Rec2 family competence protein [Candidatus Howiella sp.]|jgi:competence protein ComEC